MLHSFKSQVKASLVIWVLFLVANTAYPSLAQQNTLDSLRGEISKIKSQDSVKVKAIVGYAIEALNNNTSDFLPYLREVIAISKNIGYKRGLQKGYMIGQIYYSDRGEYEKAFLFADSAFTSLRSDSSTNALVNLGHLYNNVAGDYFKIGDYEKAIENLTASARIFEPMDHPFLATVYSTFAEVYEKTNESEKAIAYDIKAVAIAEKNNNPRSLAVKLLNFSMRRINRKEFAEASALLKKAEPIIIALENTSCLWQFNYNSAYIDEDKKDYHAAVAHYKKALYYATANEDVYQKTTVMEALSDCLMTMHEMDEAKVYVDSLLLLANQYNLRRARYTAFINLGKWHELQQEYKLANGYIKKAMALNDSLVSEETKVKIGDLEVRYGVEKKEQEINTLRAETKIQALTIQQKSFINILVVGGGIIALIISLLIYRTHWQKQKIQQQRITELETEKKLADTEAVLQGEEQERTRLAKDLHDGLGSMLSGIKYSFGTMKENLVMTPENQHNFERSMAMLDTSIHEMRRVAHNMMPEALLRFGLDAALKDFCSDVNQNSSLKVTYQSMGLHNDLFNQSTSIAVYRITQELINNILKHAEASLAIVQLTKTESVFTLTVEDNGKGFNTATLADGGGIGLSNIKHRVDFLKGTLDIKSQPGDGTSVHIEFNLI